MRIDLEVREKLGAADSHCMLAEARFQRVVGVAVHSLFSQFGSNQVHLVDQFSV